MIDVAHHGLHWADDGVAWLQQGLDGLNAIGLKDPTPFKVLRGCATCNHRIVMSTNKSFDLENHPLFEVFYPIPKEDFGIYYIVDDGDPALLGAIQTMTMLSSPIRSPMTPIWATARAKIVKQMFSTNLQPVVMTDIKIKDVRLLNEVIQLAVSSPSKLILVGSSTVPVPKSIPRLNPEIDRLPKKMPDMKKMGATALWRHMRGE